MTTYRLIQEPCNERVFNESTSHFFLFVQPLPPPIWLSKVIFLAPCAWEERFVAGSLSREPNLNLAVGLRYAQDTDHIPSSTTTNSCRARAIHFGRFT